MPKKTTKTSYVEPYKKEEFEKFLDLLRGESVHYWGQIAQVMGVSPETIKTWRDHPAAQKAIRDGIENAVEGMTRAGKDDWRMWESKLKMMGVSPVEKSDITSGGKSMQIGLVSYKDK